MRLTDQSVADMAKATPEQLLLCPGFGQVKVRRLREAFDKPFHVGQSGNKPVSAVAHRPPSPVWDIELDLNDSDVEESPEPPPTKKRKPNEPIETEGDL